MNKDLSQDGQNLEKLTYEYNASRAASPRPQISITFSLDFITLQGNNAPFLVPEFWTFFCTKVNVKR